MLIDPNLGGGMSWERLVRGRQVSRSAAAGRHPTKIAILVGPWPAATQPLMTVRALS